MRDIHVTGETLPSAYHAALCNLLQWGDWVQCSDWNTKALEVSATMTVTTPLKEPMISKFFIGGPRELQQYTMEMLDGILDFEVERGKWAYTYHQRYQDQIPFILQELRRNPDSRRAVMTIRDKDADMGSDDPACFCKGTKILTPDGYRNIEDLVDGDTVFTYDFDKDDYVQASIKNCFVATDDCVKVSTFFNNVCVSKEQLIYTKNGWKKAIDLKENDYILYSDININTNYSLWHLIGCLMGDGWITMPAVNPRGIRRKGIGLSIHPKANIFNCQKLLSEFTKNTLNLRESIVNSKLVSGNHMTRKFEVCDYRLHDLLMNYVPCGKKVSGNMLFSADDLSKECMIDFLTGIFSAEGSIVYHKGAVNQYPTIEFAMVWKECVEEVDKMLSILNIEHKCYFYDNHKQYKVRIASLYGLLNFIESGVDFRFDSRKQIKFLNLKYICYKTHEAHKFYNGNVKWETEIFDRFENALFVPVENVESIGREEVYDFTVDNEFHNVLANNIVSHNCLQHIQYFIRHGRLDCMVLFRSNDACKATFMNAFALIMLQKRLADELGVEVGTYVHRANSFHCYEKDHARLEAFVCRMRRPRPQLTYYYEGDWQEEMEECIPEILAEVEELKCR